MKKVLGRLEVWGGFVSLLVNVTLQMQNLSSPTHLQTVAASEEVDEGWAASCFLIKTLDVFLPKSDDKQVSC